MAKTILSEDQKFQVIEHIKSFPDKSVKQIAEDLNFPFECVRSVKAHVTMGTYEKEYVDESIDFEISLSMERDLQTFLLSDLGQIEKGLKLYDGGKEFSIDVGRIDILAQSKNNDFEERLKYAVKSLPNVKLKAYKVNFSFSDIS